MRRFQIHLSTAVLLTFVAGALIWANALPVNETSRLEHMAFYSSDAYGWPWPALVYTHEIADGKSVYEGIDAVNKMQLAGDVFVAIAILSAVWFVSEWWVQRRQ